MKKAVGYIGVFIAVLNLLLVAFGVITWQLFWIVIVVLAGVAYLVLPAMNKFFSAENGEE